MHIHTQTHTRQGTCRANKGEDVFFYVNMWTGKSIHIREQICLLVFLFKMKLIKKKIHAFYFNDVFNIANKAFLVLMVIVFIQKRFMINIKLFNVMVLF